MITVKSRARKYLKNKKKYFFIQRFSYLNKMTRRLLYIKRIRIQTNGVFKIPNNTCLFIYNHKSNIDALVLIRQLYDYCTNVNPDFRFLFIAKKEIKDKKNFVTAILDLLDTLYIDRADIRQQVRVYDEQKKQIDQHCSILIAPEGTRNKDHAFGEFKPGSIRLAFDKMIPIQPIVL
jgi:1-acyl-sn-glycerol-3-phosphate acyltransferase